MSLNVWILALNSSVCMEFDVVLLALFTDFRHFESSNILGFLAILAELVFPWTAAQTQSLTWELFQDGRLVHLRVTLVRETKYATSKFHFYLHVCGYTTPPSCSLRIF